MRVMPRQNQSVDPDRVRVLIAGTKVVASAVRHDPEPFQVNLHEARQRFGGGICLCQDKQLQLVIRERNSKLFLACWPDQAQEHALDCPFYSAPRDGGSQKYTSGAITEDGPNTNIQLHHPLLQPTPNKKTEGRTPPTRAAGLSKLHLWGLLHHLWESGGLNRWNPGWKRDWGLVRYMVRRAAQSTSVDGVPLLSNMYVPPIWSVDRKAEILSYWNEFTRPLFRQHRTTELVASGVVIGLVRKLEVTESGFSIRLKNHSDIFYIDKQVADRLASYSRKGWSVLRTGINHTPTAGPGPKVIAALRIQAKATKALVVVEGVLMRVSPTFIPISSSFEERLAELLVEQNRRFIRPLHYDIQSLDLAHFVLTDCAGANVSETGPQRVALYVYGTAIAPTYQRTLEAKDRIDAKNMGCGYWKWNVSESKEIPSLPPVYLTQFSPHPTQPSKE
jgi:hypothetical protein